MAKYITINGTDYPVKFGFGFAKRINAEVKEKVEGTNSEQCVGLRHMVAKIMDKDVYALVHVLIEANRDAGEPKLTLGIIEEWLDDETVDIYEVFDMVMGFFENSNYCKTTVMSIKDAIKASEDQQAKMFELMAGTKE